jgi:hypothetical protein
MTATAALAIFGLASLLYLVWQRSRSGGPLANALVLAPMLFLVASAIMLALSSWAIGWLWTAFLVAVLWAAASAMLVARSRHGPDELG